jgi:hypothetical protein
MACDARTPAAEEPIYADLKSGSEIQRAKVTGASRAVVLPFAPGSNRDASGSGSLLVREAKRKPCDPESAPDVPPELSLGLTDV